jgi:hypothetical protein
MKPSVLPSIVLCGLVAFPAIASAQDQMWLKDRRYAEGAGYRVGDFELHPGAAAEFGYDSNYLHRAASEGPLGALRLRLTPSFSFATLGAQRREGAAPPTVELRGGLSLTYNEFIPIQGTAAEKSTVSSQRNLGAALDLSAVFFPGHTWSGVLSTTYLRALGATDQGVATDATGKTAVLSFNRDLPRASAELVFTPGAGLFEWRLGYSFAGTVFEDTKFSTLTNLNNQVTTRGRWRFLPRTSLTYDASFGFISYTNPAAETQGGKTSSHPMRARIGVNGLITSSFSILAMGGWGASFYTPKVAADGTPSENFDSAIGQVELKWFITPQASVDSSSAPSTLSSVSVGFTRDFFDSFIGTYYERDRGYLSFSYLYGGKFLVVVDGGGGPIIYPQLTVAAQTAKVPAFTDIRVDAGLLAEYRFKDAFGVNASVRYNENINKQPVPVGSGMTDDLSFRQIEAYLGFRWLM